MSHGVGIYDSTECIANITTYLTTKIRNPIKRKKVLATINKQINQTINKQINKFMQVEFMQVESG